MKNFDVKKLIILIVIIAAIVVAIVFAVKKFSGKEVTEEEKTNAENLAFEYYANMTRGYSTPYSGLDYLYSLDKVTYDDLEKEVVLNIAISYATDNNINLAVPTNVIDELKAATEYKSLNDFNVYDAEGIRTAIKELFGVDFTNTSAYSSVTFMYRFYYDSKYDVYLVERNNVPDSTETERRINYKIIDTVKKKDNIEITFAIAYMYDDGSKVMVANDPNGNEIIVKDATTTDFPEDKVDSFTKYKITLKPGEKDKYVFDSFEKLK